MDSTISLPEVTANTGFVKKWSDAKAAVVVTVVLMGFIEGLYGGLPLPTPDYLGGTAMFCIYFAVCIRIARDRVRYPRVAEQYGGAAFYILWPVLICFYYAQTRGFRRMVVAARFILLCWIVAIALGYSSGRLIASIIA